MLPAENEPELTVKMRFAELAAFVSIPRNVEGFDGPCEEPLNVVAVAAKGENTLNSDVVVVVAPIPKTTPVETADSAELVCTALEYP